MSEFNQIFDLHIYHGTVKFNLKSFSKLEKKFFMENFASAFASKIFCIHPFDENLGSLLKPPNQGIHALSECRT